MDREHFLQLTAATPPIILQHLQSGWKGWQRMENAELKRQADRQLIGMVPKVCYLPLACYTPLPCPQASSSAWHGAHARTPTCRGEIHRQVHDASRHATGHAPPARSPTHIILSLEIRAHAHFRGRAISSDA